MKLVIMAMPGMGKTTFVRTTKAYGRKGVDLDIHKSHLLSGAARRALARYCWKGMTSGEFDYVVTHYGTLHLPTLLRRKIKVVMVVPSIPACPTVLSRVMRRGDSKQFVDAYTENILEWRANWISAAMRYKDAGCIVLEQDTGLLPSYDAIVALAQRSGGYYIGCNGEII